MGVINVACTGLELSILPDLGTDRLLYLVTFAKGGKGRMELTTGFSKAVHFTVTWDWCHAVSYF